MRQVVTLIGRNAGELVWMKEPTAQAAISAGTAALPGSVEAINARVRAGYVEETPPVLSNRRELSLARSEDGPLVLVGDFPENIIVTSANLASRFFSMSESGEINVEIGGRRAKYRALQNNRGEVWADLVESSDGAPQAQPFLPPKAPEAGADEEKTPENEPVAEEAAPAPAEQAPQRNIPEIPESWRRLHWKQRIKIAEQIAGVEPKNAEEANEIIASHVST